MASLTPARRKALEVLGRAGGADIAATTDDTLTPPTVSRTAAGWLVEQGYAVEVATIIGRGVGKRLSCTQEGLTAYMAQVGPGDPPEAASGAESGQSDPVEEEEPGEGEEEHGDEEGTVAVPAGALSEFEGQMPIAVLTKVVGTSQRITREIHHRERGVAIIEWEGSSVAFPLHKDGIKRVQTITILDLIEMAGPAGRQLLNELKLKHDPSPLPFKQKADAEIFGDAADAMTAFAESIPVAVIFGSGARAAWPDDFPKDTARPVVGERLPVPGTRDAEEVVVELLSMIDGSTISVLTDEHDEEV